MLKHLYIKNYALIEELDIDFSTGFSVITGETGAGKSILLGAIGLLLGQRADSKAIQTGASKCTIEAEFSLQGYNLEKFFEENDLDFDGQSCIIRRELTSAGKSRAFINDIPANVAQLKELGNNLIDIHSQHQNLLLGQENFQLNVLDTMAQDKKELETYQVIFHKFKAKERELKEAKERLAKARSEEDFLQFQYDELLAFNPQENEDETLEEQQNELSHAEDIKTGLYQACGILNNDEDGGAMNALYKAKQVLQSLTRIYPKAEELANRIDACYIEAKEISAEVEDMVERVEYNPEQLEQVNQRIDTLYHLEKKHNAKDSNELKEIMQQLESQLKQLGNADEDISTLEKELKETEEKANLQARLLTDKRTKASSHISQEIQQALTSLGMPNVQFDVLIQPLPALSETGIDNVSFLFSANKNAEKRPISEVASGGEIARLMLSLKAMTSHQVQLPTIIFDEIDTGVSGRIAEAMAYIMRDMCKEGKHQVITITHLPQIAACGTSHYRVYKEDTTDRTISQITSLSPEERVHEIAHMLSGAEVTEAAIENAKQLLKR